VLYAYNLTESKNLLLQAGKDLGFSPASPVTYTITTSTARPYAGYIATQLASNINSLNAGITLNVQTVVQSEFAHLQAAHLIPVGIVSDPEPILDPTVYLNDFYLSSGFFGIRSGYDNPVADQLYQEQLVATTPQQRAAIIANLTQTVNNDVAYVWFGAALTYGQPVQGPNIMRTWVNGFTSYNPGFSGYYLAYLWKGDPPSNTSLLVNIGISAIAKAAFGQETSDAALGRIAN